MLRVHVRALNCDPSKSNYICIWLHNESRSESLYEAACLLTGSVVLQENQAIVQTGMWSFLAVAKNVRVPWYSQLAYWHHGSPAVKCWPFLYYCCSFTIPLVKMPTVRLKLPYIAKYSQILRIDHVCKGWGLRDELLTLCLEVEGILVLCNLADSFTKVYSRTFLPAICEIISSWKFCNIYIYI